MTQPSEDIAGAIRITLTPAGGRVGSVAIASTRPAAAARIFEGLAAGEMTARIGRVFSLCGAAQTVAALEAVEQALGIAPAPGVAAAREAARMSEMITQTVMRLALHWPSALGLDLRPDLVRAALAVERALEARILGADWRQPGAALAAPGELGGSLVALMALATDPLPAALAEVLAARGIEGFGALVPGQEPEAGALSRNWEAPVVAEARARHGPGLAARLAAARHDLATLPGALAAALTRAAETPARPATRASGHGTATVETARGPLTHRVEIAEGIVTACATEAPTEANFTAHGPVASGLVGAPLDPVAAELHVLAIDPCVACSIDMADG
jgi:uptake hydrogenase large subunit